jgi:hypothetical protein
MLFYGLWVYGIMVKSSRPLRATEMGLFRSLQNGAGGLLYVDYSALRSEYYDADGRSSLAGTNAKPPGHEPAKSFLLLFF